jgi:EAL domain-containing protein (putative c-di-GMP-specific phosphodiesterase class I)
MFKCDDVFIDQLQLQIDYCRDQSAESIFLLVEVANSTKLRVSYGDDFLGDTITNLIDTINELFLELPFINSIQNEYIAIIIKDKSAEDLEEIVTRIHKAIQFYSSDKPECPVHIISTISSLILNDELKSSTQALERIYLTAKNNKFDENKFHYTYQEIEESKNNYKNQFILANCLKSSMLNKKLRLAYQPIINSKTGAVSHYECLLRIVNNEGKIISAGPFIPIAEELGFINLIDELVLEMVVEELKASPHITLTFNLSTIGVYNDSWLKKIQTLVSDHELASRLIIEITETAAHKDLGKAAYFIATLQEMGCLVALDDFGSGNTSFRQLKALPVDLIKIDGSFIRDIVKNAESQLFVKTLITMSRGFGLRSIAEFVENGEIAKMLIEYKVDYMQGNYFCPAVNYRSWMNESM